MPQDTQQGQGVDPSTWLAYLAVYLLQAGTSWPPQPVLPAPSSQPVLRKGEGGLSVRLLWGDLLPHPLDTSLTLFALCLPSLCSQLSAALCLYIRLLLTASLLEVPMKAKLPLFPSLSPCFCLPGQCFSPLAASRVT